MECKNYLFDILECEKNLVNNYSYALNEASCSFLYKKYNDMFEDMSKLTKEQFGYAYDKNWFTLTSVEQKDIDKEHKRQKDILDNL